jgi:hypothetical protein
MSLSSIKELWQKIKNTIENQNNSGTQSTNTTI